jgi:hypothetical protein
MSNTVCLVGPSFSISGEILFVNQLPSFILTFDSSDDQALVIAYEWYMDGLILLNQQLDNISTNTSLGSHIIGARILTSEGWSGIRELNFRTYPQHDLIVDGPSKIVEGKKAMYTVLAKYPDNTIDDVTSQYTFSATEGSFNNSEYTAISNNIPDDTRQITLIVSKGGIQQTSKDITIINATPFIVISRQIMGPDSINEGSSGTYKLMAGYSDGSNQDLTHQYQFQSTEGIFNSGVLSIPNNSTVNDSRTITIVAFKNGIQVASKQINIIDNTPAVFVSAQIMGPGSIDEGSSAIFNVIATFSDSSTADVSNFYTFNSPEGSFTGSTLSIPINTSLNDNRTINITAFRTNFAQLSKSINIINKTLPYTYVSSWQFTESGALTNWNGSARSYNSDNIPTGALWSVTPNSLNLRITYEASENCGGINNLIQAGTAIITINLNQNATLKLTWLGMGEIHSTSFETAKFYIGTSLIGQASSPGGGSGCGVGPVISTNNYPNGYNLEPGEHTLKIECTTGDGLYNTGAYYEISLEILAT